MQFASLGLSSPILRALTDEGYTIPTPIQMQAIPPVMEGRDLLGCAQTGTGKTAAFALPILHRLAEAPVDKTRRGPVAPRVLILSPTRELATQIAESFAAYGRHTRLAHAVIYGGVSQYHQEKALRRGVDVIVATPGRLMDLMQQGLMDFSEIGVFVLDEADRMLDMGFIQPIRRIAAALPKERQTLLFSATMPREIRGLAESLLKKDHVNVAVTPVAASAALIEESLYMVSRSSKPALLEHLLAESGAERALVFTRTKHGADRLSKHLVRAGVSAEAIHGNKSQNQRERALAGFRSGRARVLVATDVAARGLDVDGVTHVFNFDLPNEPEAYVHRIGRTGRAGAKGIAISFCDHEERGFLRAIEKVKQSRVPLVSELPTLPAPAPRDNSDSEDRRRDDARPARYPRPERQQQSQGNPNRPAGPRSAQAGPGGFNNNKKQARPFGANGGGANRSNDAGGPGGPSDYAPALGGSGAGGKRFAKGPRRSRGPGAGGASGGHGGHAPRQGRGVGPKPSRAMPR